MEYGSISRRLAVKVFAMVLGKGTFTPVKVQAVLYQDGDYGVELWAAHGGDPIRLILTEQEIEAVGNLLAELKRAMKAERPYQIVIRELREPCPLCAEIVEASEEKARLEAKANRLLSKERAELNAQLYPIRKRLAEIAKMKKEEVTEEIAGERKTLEADAHRLRSGWEKMKQQELNKIDSRWPIISSRSNELYNAHPKCLSCGTLFGPPDHKEAHLAQDSGGYCQSCAKVPRRSRKSKTPSS